MPTDLDFQQVIRNIYDEVTNRIRTDTATVLDGGDLDVSILHTEDSIRLGDGTNFITSTTIGSDVGLDVNVINPLFVEIDAADGDNIAIHDNEGDELEINSDGSIIIGNTIGAADFNAGITGVQTLRTSSNITRNGTELSYNSGSSDLNTLRVSSNLKREGNDLDYDYGIIGINSLRTASQIGNATGASDFNAGITGTQTLRTSSNITHNGTELSYNIGTPDANTLRIASILSNSSGQIDYNHGVIGNQTIRVASILSNETTKADFNAGTTASTTLRTTSNITRDGTELSYNSGTSDANTLRISSNLKREGNDLDYNFGAASANSLRTSSLIGNSTGAADFNSGAPTAQTLRVASDLFDETGIAFSETNPLPISIGNAGTAINDYATTASLAKDATTNHDYTVTVGKTFYLSQIEASSSGRLKIEVQVDLGAGLVTKFVQFNSSSSPICHIKLEEHIAVSATNVIRIILTNKDNNSQDVYSTISGHEV